MKKLLSLVLVVIMLAGCLPAFAADATWSIDANGVLGLQSGVTLQGDVVIPEEVDGITVTSLKAQIFNNQTEITSITMPDTIQALDSWAITYLEGVTSVKLSNNLSIIGATNFCGLDALKEITIPASVSYIEESFGTLDSIEKITFEGECPLFIGDSLYSLNRNCTVYVPDDQVDAYKEALSNGYGSEDMVKPSGKNAVTYSNPADESDFVFDAATGTITGYTGTDSRLEFPATIGGTPVKAIGNAAFQNNKGVYYLVIPEGIETIEEYAFSYCSNMVYASFPSTLRTIGDKAFYGCYFETIDWSEGLEEIGKEAFCGLSYKRLTLPKSLRVIGEGAFENAYLTHLYLGDQVESIGARAFANCYISYMEFDLDHMIDIASDAFENNSDEASLYVAWDSDMENYYAYQELFAEIYPGCTVNISSPTKCAELNLEYPADGTDSYDNGVWKTYNGTQENLMTWYTWNRIVVYKLADGLFKGNQTIKTFYPHHTFEFTTIGNEAFADSSVEYVDLFHGITTIGEYAFRNCVNMKEVTIPATVESIGIGAFDGCTGLEKITFLCDPSAIPVGLLDTCTALTEINAWPDATDEDKLMLEFALKGKPEVVITQQPADVTVPAGETAEVTVQATGEGLTYEWYYTNGDSFIISDNCTGDTYSIVMSDERDGREAYCVITDQYGTSVTSEKATLRMAQTLKITSQPVDAELPEGELAQITVEAKGEGLTYVWYVMPNDKGTFEVAEGFNTNTYEVIVDESSDWTQVYCVITDAYGNSVTSEEASIFVEKAAAPAVEIPPLDASAEPYFGVWNLVSAEIDGMNVDSEMLEMFGLKMIITLNADGTAAMDMAGDITEGIVWGIVDGVIYLSAEGEVLPVQINDDGTLTMDLDGKMVFAKEGEAAVTTDPVAPVVPVSGDAADYVGVWTAISAEADGMTLDKEMLEMFGMNMTITLNADGTAAMDMAGEVMEGITWVVEGSELLLTAEGETLPAQINADGTLTMDFGAPIVFAKEGEAAVTTDPVAPVAPVTGDPADYVGTWVDEVGVLVLNADGTAEYTGKYSDSTDEHTWEMTENGAVFTDYMWNGSTMVLEADGTLNIDEGWHVMTREDAEAPAQTAAIEDFYGVWDGVYAIAEGETLYLDDYDMTMVFTINPDGSALVYDGEYEEETLWSFDNGTMYIDAMTLTMTDEGLCVEEDGACMYFEFVEAVSSDPVIDDPSVNAVYGTMEDFVGVWNGTVMEVEGMEFKFSDLDMTMILTLNADGTATLDDGTGAEEGTWTLENGAALVEGMLMTLTEDGRLSMEADGAVMYFERGEAGVSDPAITEIPAQPIAGEWNDFVGLWTGAVVEIEGIPFKISELEMMMELTLNEDGTCMMFDGAEEVESTWTLEDGVAVIEGQKLILMDNGTLILESEGAKIIFTGFTGTWHMVHIATAGMNGDPRDMIGMTWKLILNADSTGSFEFLDPAEGMWYQDVVTGNYYFKQDAEDAEGMIIMLMKGGFLKYGTDMGGYMIFSQDENAEWDPSLYAVEEEEEETDAEKKNETSDGAITGNEQRMNRKFICKTYTVLGQTMDASAMPGEYSLYFYEDGTVDFCLSGTMVPKLPWGLDQVSVGLSKVDAFVINYYSMMFNAVLTDTGFDMDYGTMTLHFVPAE